VSITRVVCPECKAGLKSATGFAVGQTVCCSKCETYFVVTDQMADPADDFAPTGKKRVADEPEWSYRKSPLRYVVLGVLLVILGVVSYLYYEKKIKTSEDTVRTKEDDEGRPVDVRVDPGSLKGLPQLQPQTPGGVPTGPPAGKGPKGPPKLSQQQRAELEKRLIGTWASGPNRIEYKADGTFEATTTSEGVEKKLTGKWKLLYAERPPVPGGDIISMQVEWTPEGKSAIEDQVVYNGGQLAVHPILAPDGSGKKPGENFEKK
jgi:hypothetical protein